MTQKELIEGKVFHFSNESFCEENLIDDVRAGFISFDNRFKFSIHFNGACIHISKTFKSAEKRLETLMLKWHCNFISEESIC
jgi:hypothetical protein